MQQIQKRVLELSRASITMALGGHLNFEQRSFYLIERSFIALSSPLMREITML